MVNEVAMNSSEIMIYTDLIFDSDCFIVIQYIKEGVYTMRMIGWTLIVFSISMLSCNEERIGACHYESIPGTATILSVDPASESSYACIDPVDVIFVFTPDDPSAPEEYLFPQYPDTSNLTVGAGMLPPMEWVIIQNIVVGNQYDCERMEDHGGACPPVVFELSGIDFSHWADYCWE